MKNQENKKQSDADKVRNVAKQIEAILNENGMGMQPVIQIFTLENQPSPIIMAGGEGDIPPHIVDMLRPQGDKFDS